MQYLMERYFNDTCTAEERQELAEWISEAGHDDDLKAVVAQTWERFHPADQMPDEVSARIQAALFSDEKLRVRSLYRWLAAACVLLLAVGAGLFWLSKSEKPAPQVAQHNRYKNEVPAGGNKAVLTLGDGTVINLDSAANGVLTTQGRVRVVKLANGQLSYELEGQADGVVLYNTMRTPRGGEYRLSLPDGTIAWLNAASSITYPTAFTGDIRDVKITGEVYFEVAKDAGKPFMVEAGKMKIEVLGTHFNVNAYAAEPMVKTTLLEGAVKVSGGGRGDVLQPGQQAQLARNGDMKVVDDVDLEAVMAWKNGYFQFLDADMPAVMRQLENWYDVTVSYEEGFVPRRSFGGGIQRSLPLSKVLTILEENNVRFRVEGKNITVLK
ncbi:iron dicitrate transporter FecR [Chitinophaga cymbidii]|uniref:Iron dicitrate transporter FecR n=2 Tax=Chitinophaga cymbidii TaxID=1096750 RepID=A0A512RJE0_9BACT|nr:iron dicitrate transporter FecR [Chitinophaga cymbidii]